MNMKFSLLTLALVGSFATAALEPVWSAADGNGPVIHPFGKWYIYKDGTGAKIDTSTTATAKSIIATVSKTAETSAGAGFAWAAKDAAIDLSAYQGVCLTYSAKADFRMDFKQSSIKNYNYNGFVVPAQASIDTLFIPFADFAQEDWGDETVPVALDLTKQTGVQFSYKKALVTTLTANTINIAAIALGSSCSNHAPNLKAGVLESATAELLEGDTLKIAFADIFEDADGDDLNVVMQVSGEMLVDLKGAKSYSLKDVAWLKSGKNPPEGTTATVVVSATDPAGLAAKYTLELTLVDRENAPVAVDDEYEVEEDSKLTVLAAKGVLANDYDDDGDDFTATIKSEPANGTLVFNGSGFIYTPNPDFYGTDSFTYFVSDDGGLESEVATVTIKVTGVDDPAEISVIDSTIYLNAVSEENAIKLASGISVDEDFDGFDLYIPVANIDFVDPDALGSDFSPSVKSEKGIVHVDYAKIGSNHVLSVTSVPDANGKDAVVLYIVDGKDTLGVSIPVTVAPVADPPVANADTFAVLQDSVNTVAAAKGVLANDVNPDGKSVLKAYLSEDATHGKVTLDTTGAFTYAAEDYEGEDTFTYFVVNAEGDTSEVATVVLNVTYKNKAPVIVAGVEDTVGTRFATLKEDFGTTVQIRAAEVKSWFEDPEGDAITYSISNPDSLVNVTMNSTAAVYVKKVKDACGETSFGIVATDAKGASTTLKVPVSIECVNDAPVRLSNTVDTIIEPASGWREAIYVFDLFSDVDDTVLTMKVTLNDVMLSVTVEGDSLIVKLADETQYLQKLVPYKIQVKATDPAGLSSVAKTLIIMEGERTPIPQIAATPKATWQNAILAARGTVALFDMQGRVMWKAKLPVNEADVRNASDRVQGRKILMVNRQTWTIR